MEYIKVRIKVINPNENMIKNGMDKILILINKNEIEDYNDFINIINEYFKKYGKIETARLIARKHLEAMSRTFREFEPHTIWECYSPEYMRPSDREDVPLVRPDFVGWSGLGPIAFLSDPELWPDFRN